MYDSPRALRLALEQRLRNENAQSGVPVDRLRRRVMFDRLIARLVRAEPGQWVLKGGMALEVRLGDGARLTKDVDLGLREAEVDSAALHDRLVDALDRDEDGDGFRFGVRPLKPLAEDGAGRVSWRAPVDVRCAGRTFGAISVDVSPRPHELGATEAIRLSSPLAFAGLRPVDIEIVDVHRHAAEKLHAMLRDFGERENSRVRDLVDLMLLRQHNLLAAEPLATSVRSVWEEREATPPPRAFPALPIGWAPRYERMAIEYAVDPSSFDEAVLRAVSLWDQLLETRER